MIDTVCATAATGIANPVLTRLHDDIDELRELPLDLVDNDAMLALWRELETLTRRLASVEHTVIAETAARHLDFDSGARNMTCFARQLLRINPGDARTRIAAAEAAAPRRALTGQPMPPSYPGIAAAQAAGQISNQHARIISHTIDTLPDAAQHEHGEGIETFFVEQARLFDPVTLQRLATHQLEVLGIQTGDPDYRERRRAFRLHVRPDGSCSFAGEGTAEFAENLRIAFDTLARPRPDPADTPDPAHTTDTEETSGPGPRCPDLRTAEQRRHDAIIDLVHAGMRAGQLPDTGGLAATLILTTSAENWASDTGSVTTGHGATIPTSHARHWISGDTRIIAVALNRLRAVTAYSGTHRIFTTNQRLAMTARDHGCTFPACDAPTHQCQAHHITEHRDAGPTTITNGALLCAHHHRTLHHSGWHATMINGIPHYIPPRWLDPTRTPLRNHMHHPAHNLAPD